MSAAARTFADGEVRGFLHEAPGPAGDALVLTHGAGSNCTAPLLVAVAAALAESGVAVLRVDLPYRQMRPSGPPGPGDAERDREGLRLAAAAARRLGAERVVLGGQSYGGRQASMLAAADPELAAGLLLLSYPLHPPRRGSRLRTAHFADLQRPALFAHGTRDPFGSVEEMRAALALIPARTELLVIEGGGHGLPARVAGQIAVAYRRFFGA